MVNVVRPCWISTLEPFNGMWHLSENGKPRGQFDVVIIAHNGDSGYSFFFFLNVIRYSFVLRKCGLLFVTYT